MSSEWMRWPALPDQVIAEQAAAENAIAACENGCPDGYLGRHESSCAWTGRWFHAGEEVRVLGTGRTEACLEPFTGEASGHRHVPQQQLNRVRFPGVTVHLSTGQDGSIFAVIGTVSSALRRAGLGHLRSDFATDISSAGSYPEALSKIMRWVTVT